MTEQKEEAVVKEILFTAMLYRPPHVVVAESVGEHGVRSDERDMRGEMRDDPDGALLPPCAFQCSRNCTFKNATWVSNCEPPNVMARNFLADDGENDVHCWVHGKDGKMGHTPMVLPVASFRLVVFSDGHGGRSCVFNTEVDDNYPELNLRQQTIQRGMLTFFTKEDLAEGRLASIVVPFEVIGPPCYLEATEHDEGDYEIPEDYTPSPCLERSPLWFMKPGTGYTPDGVVAASADQEAELMRNAHPRKVPIGIGEHCFYYATPFFRDHEDAQHKLYVCGLHIAKRRA